MRVEGVQIISQFERAQGITRTPDELVETRQRIVLFILESTQNVLERKYRVLR